MTIRIFRHYVSAPLALLAIVEAVIFISSVYLGAVLRFGGTEFSLTGAAGEALPVLPRALLVAFVMVSTLTAIGLYRWDTGKEPLVYVARYLASFAVGAVILLLVFYLVPWLFMGRGVMTLTLALALAGSATARALFHRSTGIEAFKRRVLVLGAGSRAAEVSALAAQQGDHARFRVVGYLPLKGEQPAVDRSRILHEKCSVLALAEKYNVDEIVVGIRDRRGGRMSIAELLECKLEGVNIVDLPTFFERETGHVQLASVNTSWMVFSDGFLRNSQRDIVKRLFDMAVSGTLLLLVLPIMVLTAMAILAETGRPIFYRQQRIGECGLPFNIFKFRSMRADAEMDGVARWAKQNDERVTRVGKFIRTSRIDELPQIFNVFRGDMSFVGPRPERAQFVHALSKEIPYYANRHTVKPGITGWAQVRYPYGASVEDAREKLQYDLYYVKNHSLFLDLLILFETAQVVLWRRGAR